MQKTMRLFVILLASGLIAAGLLMINYQRTGAVSEIGIMKECSTGIVLSLGGFMLLAASIRDLLRDVTAKDRS